MSDHDHSPQPDQDREGRALDELADADALLRDIEMLIAEHRARWPAQTP